MKLSEFNYFLPKTRIAQYPLRRRDASRLLVLYRGKQKIEHRSFRDLPDYLRAGDALVLNDTKVKRARMFGKKETGGKVEALFLRRYAPFEYEVLLTSSSRLKQGMRMMFDGRVATLVGGDGTVKRIRFEEGGVEGWMRRKGSVPLPPYIERLPEKKDLSRYQTVYARKEGAVAAPTAGLHFTKRLLRKLKDQGVRQSNVTLHVGYGTFEPVKNDTLQDHKMHEESFELSSKSSTLLNGVRRREGRIVAVGTTSCRVLETVFQKKENRFRPMKGWTSLFIYPPYSFQGTDALLTNFHLPKTTLFMLVSAFAGINFIRRAYQEAIEKGYRFYSYGDTMLIL